MTEKSKGKEPLFDEKVKKYVYSTKEMANSIKEAVDEYMDANSDMTTEDLEEVIAHYVNNYSDLWEEGHLKKTPSRDTENLMFTLRFILGKKRAFVVDKIIEDLYRVKKIKKMPW